jgi:hypothetical protein
MDYVLCLAQHRGTDIIVIVWYFCVYTMFNLDLATTFPSVMVPSNVSEAAGQAKY